MLIVQCNSVVIESCIFRSVLAMPIEGKPRVNYYPIICTGEKHSVVYRKETVCHFDFHRCNLAVFLDIQVFQLPNIYRLITAYLLLRVNLDKIMHARWDFDASSARIQRVSALDKHQNWSASALFCLNSRA